METNSLRKKAIKAINETNFSHAKGKERLMSMIEGRPIGAYLDKEFGVFHYQFF